jgi:hypothetical protein
MKPQRSKKVTRILETGLANYTLWSGGFLRPGYQVEQI